MPTDSGAAKGGDRLTRRPFVMLSLDLVEQCAERKGALFVYAWLWHYAGRDDAAWPSLDRLALECRMKRDDVRAALKWLTAEGWITREDRPGATSIFHVRTENPSPKRGTPPPDGGTPKRGTPPLPQKGDPTPPPKGATNKKPLTRSPEQEQTPLTPLSIATPPPQPPLQGGSANVDPFQIQQLDQALASASLANRQQRTTTALPPCAEPHRELVTAWWRRRLINHPTAPRQLDPASITAIEAAHAAGVLEAFLKRAADEGAKSLGHHYRKRIAALTTSADTTGFDEFRAAYLAAKKRATNQSIPKAITAYGAAIATGITPQQLLAALRANIRAQHEAEAHGGFAVCLPDMFRWLRDGLYEAHLPRRGASGIGTGSAQPAPLRRVPDGPVDDPVALCDQIMAARRAAALA